MRNLIIICEGLTEQEFCKRILYNYFFSQGINILAPTIKHSNGGIVAWDTIKKQIIGHLNEGNCIVSLFVDYYRIKDSYNFPGWKEGKKKKSIYDRADYIFEKMSNDIHEKFRDRFVPYIQIHEFEALLFSDMSVFYKKFESKNLDIELLEKALIDKDPEEINDGPNTAPSERLKKAIKGYDKVIDGIRLSKDIGLETIRSKCLLFNKWIERIEKANSQISH